MRRRILVALVFALGGCAAPTGASRGETTTPVAARSRAVDHAAERDALRRQRERIRELEAALALAHAEAHELREDVRALEAAERTRATHIGDARCDHAEDEPLAREESAPSGARPVLRLYGEPVPEVVAGPAAPPLAAAPPPPSIRLPVVAIPGANPAAGVPAIPPAPIVVAAPPETYAPQAPPRPAPVEDEAVRAYRAALAALSERRLDEALAGLDAFLRAYPRHPYADNALYWRAEIHYARRDYARALAELSALLERYPSGNKVPDALLRMGLCHERMGNRGRAREVFERLRTQYPESVAARMASREDV